MKQRFIKIFLISGIILGIWCYLQYKEYLSFIDSPLIYRGKEHENEILLQIQKNDSITSMFSRELQLWKKEIIFLKIFFYLHYKQNISIYPGTYILDPENSLEDIMLHISQPQNNQVFITIQEWWNIFDIDTCLSTPLAFYSKNQATWKEKGCLYTKKNGEKHFFTHPLFQSNAFIREVYNVTYYQQFFPFLQWVKSLEWFLYPETYSLPLDSPNIQKLIMQMLHTFEKKVYLPYLKKQTFKDWYDTLILASIVEKESSPLWWKEEKAMIAGILLKRYKEHWKLDADATACYAQNITSKQCYENIAFYISQKNEYNTRVSPWLPPTPICNPHVSSLLAVLHPKTSPYYFYLHDSQGNIHYAKTYEEHLRNKSRYVK